MARGIAGIEDDLLRQADFCRKTSPLYAALMSHLLHALKPESSGSGSASLAASATGKGWRDWLGELWGTRQFAVWYERPLLLAMAFHDQALAQGARHPLSECYPSCGGDPKRLTPAHVYAAFQELRASAEHVELLRSGYVQTNETSRGVAWLWPLAELHARHPERYADGIVLFDLGASAGLNLVADRLPPIWTRVSTGAAVPVSPLPRLLGRFGFDREPVDVSQPRALRRLRAAVWADDLARLKRLDLAVGSARELARRSEFAVGQASLLEMPLRIGQVMAKLRSPAGEPVPALLYHSFAADYLARAERESFGRLMLSLLSDLPSGSAWIEFESARTGAKPGASGGLAEITAHVNQGGLVATEVIARAAPHPEAVDVDAPALARLLSG